MFLFAKHRKHSRSPLPPTSQTQQAQSIESPVRTYSPIHTVHSDVVRGFSTSKRSQTIARSFRSLRKPRAYEPMFAEDIEKISKTDLRDTFEERCLYADFDPTNPDHVADMKPIGSVENLDQPFRGRRRTVSASKISSLRRRSRSARSTMRSLSPKKSYIRETTSSWLDSGSKTLRDWASIFYKRGSEQEELNVAEKMHVTIKSLPIDIPTTAPSLDPIEIGRSNFMSDDIVPLTARPTNTPHLTALATADGAPSPDRFSLDDSEPERNSLPATMGISAVTAVIESPSIITSDAIEPKDPFTDEAAFKDHKDSCASNSVVASISPPTSESPQPNYDATTASQRSDASKMVPYPLRRAPAKRISISPIRAKTTEEAIERIASGTDHNDLDSDVSTNMSPSDNGSEESDSVAWATKDTHEDIRAKFKTKKQGSEKAEVMLGLQTFEEQKIHPKPLVIRIKGSSSTSSDGQSKSTVLQSESTESSFGQKVPNSTTNRDVSLKRNFRFANTSQPQSASPSPSPDHVHLPAIIALDHSVNKHPALFDRNNRFSVLAEMRNSESEHSSTGSPTSGCKCNPCNCDPCQCTTAGAEQPQPSAQCRCNPCNCVDCHCGEVLPPERAPIHTFRSQLSIISDMSEEERQCKGIV